MSSLTFERFSATSVLATLYIQIDLDPTVELAVLLSLPTRNTHVPLTSS